MDAFHLLAGAVHIAKLGVVINLVFGATPPLHGTASFLPVVTTILLQHGMSSEFVSSW